jgi:type I restriction-modification system DNA methylase subunit/very-short-patch-repair endonuclease
MSESSASSDYSKLEDSLWSAADNLRANSKLTSSEYCMPVLGIIFLRHATNRYEAARLQIEADQKSGKMPKRPPIKADFIKRRAMMLPKEARYDSLLKLSTGESIGTALVKAMDAIERDFEPLLNQLPKDYGKFDPALLEELLRVFDSEEIRTAGGDVFGRIYEYFLMKFAMQGAQDNGEFFTPPSLVQTIVNIIEPDHGIVFDPACGSGGMFVQSSHFIEDRGQDTTHQVTFFGQEKTATTIRLAKMNLAVHGLEGEIREANTFYEDVHTLYGGCDFVMANPPFNVDMVDSEKVKDDRRLPFGLPGVNKGKKVSNGNYLWISYFHSYLKPTGRAGFVMSSQASSAGHGEAEVRRKLIETGDVDAMVSIRSNFFYTRTVPCELWFIDRNKPDQPSPLAPLPEGEGNEKTHYRGGYDFTGLIERSRALRQKQTPAEEVLWELVRDRRFLGVKFRRQHQFGDYILDFYCAEQKLAIELDGPIHESHAKRDHKRDAFLTAQGVKVLRIPNRALLDDTGATLASIASQISPPLPLGEGRGEGKSSGPMNTRDHVLMIDARNIYRKVTRKIYDFSPEQLKNVTAVVWLYRGENARFARLAFDYFGETVRGAAVTHHAAYGWCTTGDGEKRLARLVDALRHFVRQANLADEIRNADSTPQACDALRQIMEQLDTQQLDLRQQADRLYDAIEKLRAKPHKRPLDLDKDTPKAIVHALVKDGPPLETLEGQIADFRSAVEAFNKLVRQGADIAERSLGAKRTEAWRKTFEMPSALDDMQCAEERLRDAHHLLRTNLRHFHWLTQRFPDAAFRDVPGLCRAVTRAEIAAADWSLTPGRYVGVAAAEVDEDFDFEQTIRDIHVELADLNAEATALSAQIQASFEGLAL